MAVQAGEEWEEHSRLSDENKTRILAELMQMDGVFAEWEPKRPAETEKEVRGGGGVLLRGGIIVCGV